jgi:hypothetical protein
VQPSTAASSHGAERFRAFQQLGISAARAHSAALKQKYLVDTPKAMLGATAGGAARLADGPGWLVVAEGIETALSLSCGLLGAPAMVWAALSTSGIRGLRLPPQPGRLTIAPDGE